MIAMLEQRVKLVRLYNSSCPPCLWTTGSMLCWAFLVNFSDLQLKWNDCKTSILFWHVVVSVKLAVEQTPGCGGCELSPARRSWLSFASRFERAVWFCLGSSVTKTKKFTKKLQLQSDFFYFSSYLAHSSVLINQKFCVVCPPWGSSFGLPDCIFVLNERQRNVEGFVWWRETLNIYGRGGG